MSVGHQGYCGVVNMHGTTMFVFTDDKTNQNLLVL